jgi:hypothetical protein
VKIRKLFIGQLVKVYDYKVHVSDVGSLGRRVNIK